MDLPDWDIFGLVAKVDTGARTSAIHVENVQENGDGTVSFEVVLSRKAQHKRVPVTSVVVRQATVRSSRGVADDRIVVSTRLQLGGIEKVIELTLVSRQKMKCRMLLGRTALKGDFVVDVSEVHAT